MKIKKDQQKDIIDLGVDKLGKTRQKLRERKWFYLIYFELNILTKISIFSFILNSFPFFFNPSLALTN